ncbi:MAG TPA: translational machinery protein [Thiobacillus sp.]|nr:MAG: translational machinery protein [Hydrogenophilales bacterium 28-61-11]OYZ55860.1 MAG: translational machinery protein [Hydrogenophilales bacterium 16-61-112]OZA48889.1 MAG: translational machinery protein [Hydrogenophilales bacterium 17-61-76]HQT30030.1 translational machinery protein [Thiobacillus sp.]HQT70938.1 translational machinery protein [Thiobacillus sp.]
MSHYHAVVWIDHNEAHVMHISPDDVETSVVKPAEPHRHLQRKRGSVSGSRQPEDQHFYHEVVDAMRCAKEILVVGPGHAKLELIKHIHAHDPKVADQVIGVETVDHPSDAQVVSYARKYFVAKDRMLSQ